MNLPRNFPSHQRKQTIRFCILLLFLLPCSQKIHSACQKIYIFLPNYIVFTYVPTQRTMKFTPSTHVQSRTIVFINISKLLTFLYYIIWTHLLGLYMFLKLYGINTSYSQIFQCCKKFAFTGKAYILLICGQQGQKVQLGIYNISIHLL